MQIKTIMRYHLTPVRMTIIKKSTKKKLAKILIRRNGTIVHYCWDGKLVQPLWKIVWCFTEKLPCDPATPLLGMLNCFSHVQLSATPWTMAYQAFLSMGFSRQEYWSGLPFPSPTTRYVCKEFKNTNLKRYMYPNVHSSIIYNSQEMEAT